MEPGGEKSVALTPAALGSGAYRNVSGFQRGFDLLLTVILAPVFLIVGATIAIAIYVDSPGPVLFRSRRIGNGCSILSQRSRT